MWYGKVTKELKMSRVYEAYLAQKEAEEQELMNEFEEFIAQQQEEAMLEMLDNYDDFINDEALIETNSN